MKYLPFFGQGKEVYFHLESGKYYPFSTLLSGKKGGFLTKSQGRLIWGTTGNPVWTLSKDQLKLILLADKFDVKQLYREFMIQTPRIELGSMKENQAFQDLPLLTRYELIRNSVIHLFQRKGHTIISEVEDIFNFYDVLLYENRAPDISARKPFKEETSFQYDPKEKESFLAKPKDTQFVVLIIERIKLGN